MDTKRFLKGVGGGVVATIAMSVFMLIGTASGMSPMPKPIPIAIIGKLLGSDTARPLLMGLAVLSHLGYGAFFGGVFALITRQVTVWKGLGLGVALWLIMQLAVLPFLGWGAFGASISPKIAIATLVLHIIYGVTYGVFMDRSAVARATPAHA